MENLPPELQHEICSWLLPHIDSTSTTQVTTSSKIERTDIYHLRLVARSLHSGASASFVKIVEDVPTKCTDQSLSMLADLVALSHVGKHVTRLTFNTRKLFLERSTSLKKFRGLKSTRQEWIGTHLQPSLVKILARTPRLRYANILSEAVDVFRHLTQDEMSWESKEQIWKAIAQNFADPMLYLMKALRSTELDATLEKLNVLSSSQNFPRSAEPTGVHGQYDAILFPKLTHMTISLSHYLISDFRFLLSAPNLTSLQIILDSRIHANSQALTWFRSSNFSPTLRSITIRMNDTHIETDTLLSCIGEITSHVELLPLLAIQDVTAHEFKSTRRVDRLPGEGRFHELVFVNVKYGVIFCCGPYYGDLDMTEPTEPDINWIAFAGLCERADRVRLRTALGERIIERSEWSW